MKIFLDYKIDGSGKGKFLTRLLAELGSRGHLVIDNAKRADVALGISRWRSKVKCPKVLRIDGIRIEHDKKAKWYNGMVSDGIRKSDVVVFQSAFAQRYIISKLGVVPERSRVIHNGAPKVARAPQVFKQIVLAGHWGVSENRKHKRLPEMLSFCEWFVGKHAEFHVSACGETRLRSTNPHILMLGNVDDTTLRSGMSASHCMLNLSDLDWCPNATVEALTAGCPVVGYAGTAVGELIESVGLRPLPFGSSYPEIETAVMGATSDFDPSGLYIENIAAKYEEALSAAANC